ncbi:MAG TPA: uracil-DNA glycosylase [Longimicrobiales bacterium]
MAEPCWTGRDDPRPFVPGIPRSVPRYRSLRTLNREMNCSTACSNQADLDRSAVYITNVVACRPPRNRNPRAAEVRAHAPWLEEQLRIVQPEIVVTLGRIALLWFMPKAKVTELSGPVQAVSWNGRPLQLLPLFHPAAALRARDLLPKLEAGFVALKALL